LPGRSFLCHASGGICPPLRVLYCISVERAVEAVLEVTNSFNFELCEL